MRIHRLTLRGIGPFKDEQHIDFDELGRSGLFLLDGPTGAGKSTVIDAIVYGLYGKPATEGAPERMVSDFLTEIRNDSRPFVDLVFSTGSGVFRVRREPQHDFPKPDGGTGRRIARIRLERLTNEDSETGSLVSERMDEANAEIRRSLGLDRQQFLNTVVLAQGAFSKFLRATSDDRQKILESVFNTKDYTQLQKHLQQLSQEANAERKEARDSVVNRLHAFAQAASVDATELQELNADSAEELTKSAERVLTRLKQEQSDRISGKQAAERIRKSAEEAYDARSQHKKLVDGKRVLLQRQALVEAKAAEIDTLRDRLAAGRRAAVVRHGLDAVGAARKDLEDSRQVWDALAARLPTDQSGLSADELAEAVRERAGEQGALETFLQAEEELDTLSSRLRTDEEALSTAQTAQEKAQRRLDEAEVRLQEIGVRVTEIEPRARELELAKKRAEDADKELDAASARDNLARQAEAAEERETRAQEAAGAAAALFHDRNSNYIAGLAGTLGADLQPGQKCPVCGSVEHPDPARPETGAVTKQDVEEAEERNTTARKGLEEAVAELQQLSGQLQEAQRTLRDRSTEAVEADRTAAHQDAQRCEKAAAELRDLGEDSDKLRTLSETTKESLLETGNVIAALKERISGNQTQLRQRQEEVERARLGFDSVRKRAEHLDSLIELLKGAEKAHRAVDQAADVVRTRDTELATLLAENGFADGDSARGALMTDAELTDAEDTITAHKSEADSVAEQLQSDDLRDVDPEEEVDLTEARQKLETARNSYEESVRTEEMARARYTESQSAWDRVAQAQERSAAIRHETAAVIRLAELATAGVRNLAKIPLASYVVMRRFAAVVDAANVRLQEMSDGQYRLQVAHDQAAGRERKLGLGLQILDDRTDRPRPTSSLSGGETFYCSLALALGLADVVQSEAGGVQLATLFVDEGFGSLDSDTLDTVMNVLGRLRESDRTVGLISHVEEMKTHIHDSVHIHRVTAGGPSRITTR